MCRLLNVIEKILTMVLAVTYLFGITTVNNIFGYIFIITISVFTFCTSIVDMFRFKKGDIKLTILNIVLILILLLNIYRPFLDNLLIKHINYNIQTLVTYSIDLLVQNILFVTIFISVLFILNFKIKNK